MPAYVIIELSILNQSEFEEYKRIAPATVAAFNGSFVVRGGKSISLEGNWKPDRFVIIQFPSVELANEWWSSDLYSKAKQIRQKAANSKVIIVEGV